MVLNLNRLSLTNCVFPKCHDGFMHLYKITTSQLFSLWLFHLSNISNNWRLRMPHDINKLSLLISRMVTSFYFLRIVNVCYSCFVFVLKVNKSISYHFSFWSLNLPRNYKEATILIHWAKLFLFCKLIKKKKISEDFFLKFF